MLQGKAFKVDVRFPLIWKLILYATQCLTPLNALLFVYFALQRTVHPLKPKKNNNGLCLIV